MSVKEEKPVLSGQRFKTRKRDEKEKYDAYPFRDAIIAGLNDAQTLDLVTKFLDASGNKLDYRRYAEPLFDILFAGGILAPGGSLLHEGEGEEPERAAGCVFRAPDSGHETIWAYYDVFNKLIRRYKYLEKSYEAALAKLIVFLRGFEAEERAKFGTLIGISLANGLGGTACLTSLFEEHLIKDGLAMEFATGMFTSWLKERDIQSVASTLKKAGLQGKLMNLLPVHKRSAAAFEKHFCDAGLGAIAEYQKAKASAEGKQELKNMVKELIEEDEQTQEMAIQVREYMEANEIQEHEAVILVWQSIMATGDWNKKEELVAEQAIKHLTAYAPLLAGLTDQGRSQLILLNRVQEFCYDNMNFTKAFSKIIRLFYNKDVMGEDVILKWYKDAHSPKGKTIFLEQMATFVTWLEQAEEESDDDGA